MMEKLNFKKDKISDIKNAIDNGDGNNDNCVDYDEWRQVR